jgi:cyclopropane fatty-acyl-phospholipid synthase-like methyltransferase
MKKQINLNQFYSQNEIEHWQQLLGKPTFYSAGDFSKTKDPREAFRNNTRNFYPFIEEKAKLLDLGCGWGGPAQLLIEEKNVDYTGVTISHSQFNYCKNEFGLNVVLNNIETMAISSAYDVVFMMESMEHIKDLPALFSMLRPVAKTLVIQTNALAENASTPQITFGASMTTYKLSEIKTAMGAARWEVIHAEDKRFHSFPTFKFWEERLNLLREKQIPFDTQLEALVSLVNSFKTNPVQWSATFPLLNIVAR